ncbi:MAG: response regulator receiver domain [Acidobacteria bacterium]|nr:response regulator receiver domain [Acidobacteriota bacterium]
MLKRLGHEVITAADGNDALRLFEIHAVDLVITDLIMPERDGLDTIRTLRRHGDVRIIAMSSGGQTGPSNYLNIASHMGAAAVLAKPFSNQELSAAIETALAPKR